MNKINPGSGDEWLEAVFQKAELADLKRRTEKQQQATQQQEAAQREQQLSTQMRNASAEIFKEIGLEVEESSWELYKQHVQLVYDNKQAGPNGKKGLTRQDLQKAAQATKSQLEQYARNYANRQTKQPPGAKLSGTPLDAGAPKSVPARAPQKSEKKTTQQIQDELAQRAGFRQR